MFATLPFHDRLSKSDSSLLSDGCSSLSLPRGAAEDCTATRCAHLISIHEMEVGGADYQGV